MQRRSTLMIPFVLGCLLLTVPGAALASETTAEWSLSTPDGRSVSFHETLAKGPVVISFWATWCKPCLKEMPHLDKMAGDFADQVTFLAVNTDDSKAVAKVAPYLQAAGYENLTVLLDTGAELQQLLQVGGILPFTLVFDGRGREIYRHIGYKAGDEIELREQIEALLLTNASGEDYDTGKPAWSEAVTATDRFEYSYDTETKKEIFENWLDVSYQFGGFRTGITLNSQAPSEEGDRSNTIEHRFFEFATGDFNIRAGHFYGLFGRGMIFNAYEDRTVRVDTRLDGLIAGYRKGRLAATVFSGTPLTRPVDVRSADLDYYLIDRLHLGATGMTFQPDETINDDGTVNREWIGSLRAKQSFNHGDYYFEYGWRDGYRAGSLDPRPEDGNALYGNLNLYAGPVSVSWETCDYDTFEVVAGADEDLPLNRPPSLAREFTWTLMNRAPHVLNVRDQKGNNLDVLINAGKGWAFVASGARIERHDGNLLYELGYGAIEKERWGDFRLLGAFGYQDSDGLRQTVMGEITWFATDVRSLTLQAEQQHVRLGGGTGFDLGAFDQQWFKLEYETAPRWAFAALLETNNKYEDQMGIDEKKGPFPAGQITYTISRGGNLNLWAGKRQEGFLCSGGVCKFEPAFEGVEIFGVFRY